MRSPQSGQTAGCSDNGLKRTYHVPTSSKVLIQISDKMRDKMKDFYCVIAAAVPESRNLKNKDNMKRKVIQRSKHIVDNF